MFLLLWTSRTRTISCCCFSSRKCPTHLSEHVPQLMCAKGEQVYDHVFLKWRWSEQQFDQLKVVQGAWGTRVYRAVQGGGGDSATTWHFTTRCHYILHTEPLTPCRRLSRIRLKPLPVLMPPRHQLMPVDAKFTHTKKVLEALCCHLVVGVLISLCLCNGCRYVTQDLVLESLFTYRNSDGTGSRSGWLLAGKGVVTRWEGSPSLLLQAWS